MLLHPRFGFDLFSLGFGLLVETKPKKKKP